METVHLTVVDVLAPPACIRCGSPSRLVGLEPNLNGSRTDVCTYQCNVCGEVQTREATRQPMLRC